MPRTFHWKWVGLLAVTLTPGLALAQAAAPQTHTVREGDTLWDLAKHYRGDPFLWPDIYRMNTTVVEDPHWIYPGEVLQLAAGDSVPRSRPSTLPRLRPGPSPPHRLIPCRSLPRPRSRRWHPPRSSPRPARRKQATLAQLTAVSANETAEQEPACSGPPSKVAAGEPPGLHASALPSAPPERVLLVGLPDRESEAAVRQGARPGDAAADQRDARRTATPCRTPPSPSRRRSGATYQIGDTLLVAQHGRRAGVATARWSRRPGWSGSSTRCRAATWRAWWPPTARSGTGSASCPPRSSRRPAQSHAVPVTEGVRAKFLGGPGRQDMKAPQMVVFLDKGRQDGVAPGDLFEIRRTARAARRRPAAHQRRHGHAAGRSRPRSLGHGPPAQHPLARHPAGHRCAAGRQAPVLTSGSTAVGAAPGGSPAPRRFSPVRRPVPSSPPVSILRGGGSIPSANSRSERSMARRSA